MSEERNEFSVCQFFPDETYEYLIRFVSIEAALKTFKECATNVGARSGRTARVIIIDGGDCIVAEWQHGKGITFPPNPINN